MRQACVLFAVSHDATAMLYALPAMCVRHIFVPEQQTRVPVVPQNLRVRLCNAEGRLTCVVDPAPLVGAAPQGEANTRTALLLDATHLEGNHLALWVSRVFGVYSTDAWTEVSEPRPPLVEKLYKQRPQAGDAFERIVCLLSLAAMGAALAARFEALLPFGPVGGRL